MRDIISASTILLLSATQALYANGWQKGFERGSPYHILNIDNLKITVVCMNDENRGPEMGYMTFHINNNKNFSGPALLESAAKQLSFQISYGDILQRHDPEIFKKTAEILAQPETFTFRYSGHNWSYTNDRQMNLDCE